MAQLKTETFRIGALPDWVPMEARHYIAHTEGGAPIRALARSAGCHASTIMRQVRKVETLRDDPLVDAALQKLGGTGEKTPLSRSNARVLEQADLPDRITLEREGVRVLRRLVEKGAVLAVAPEMDKAVVLREDKTGATARTAVVDTAIAEAMALKNWIVPQNDGRIIKYKITTCGRTALDRMSGRTELRDVSSQALAAEPDKKIRWAGAEDEPNLDLRSARARYGLTDSPLMILARRKDKNGKPFLDSTLVHAGERLREDYELAQMEDGPTQDWERFLKPGAKSSATEVLPTGSTPPEGRMRVEAALCQLGPGLSDVALHCCCYLEGLETTEVRLGWSARSGKIVLRIALMRLKRHYQETLGAGGPMIG